jgi:hypothetical protein
MQAGADFLNPQSWKGYGDVLGNPLNSIDPSGACDALITGVDGRPGWAAVDDFGAQMVVGFPLSDKGKFMGAVSMIAGGPDGQVSFKALKSALSQTPVGQKVNVIAISGGSQDFQLGYGRLSASEQERIGNVTYLIPGSSAGPLPVGTGQTSVVTAGGLDQIIPYGRPNGPFDSYFADSCGHDPACVLGYYNKVVRPIIGSGSPCPSHQQILPSSSRGSATSTINYGGGGGGGGGNNVAGGWYPVSFGGIDMYPVPVVTSTVRYQ